MKKNLEEMTEKELQIDQIKILSNINKNIRLITTIVVWSAILAVLGSLFALFAN